MIAAEVVVSIISLTLQAVNVRDVEVVALMLGMELEGMGEDVKVTFHEAHVP